MRRLKQIKKNACPVRLQFRWRFAVYGMSVLPRRGVCSRSSPREGVSVASAVALAVVTQEATDKDGNELRKNLTQRAAVVIRKPLTLQRLTRAQEITDASSVVTQETTLEDSVRNGCVYLLQSLSPSVSPSGNGCSEDSTAIYLRGQAP